MSAICGLMRLGDQPLPLDALDRMMQASSKHGPDGSGTWHDDRIAFGHQMMQITQESLAEELPFHDSQSGLAITMVGWIHNREELAGALGCSRFVSLSDSALVMKAYQQWGASFATRLVGEFAIALWDGPSRVLHLVTDPMGIRPLFYTESPAGHFAFASEISALLASVEGKPPLNEKRLAMLGVSALSIYLDPEDTCFRNVHRMLAATILSVTATGRQARMYWSPDASKRLQITSSRECTEAFSEIFEKSVAARLKSTHPVACLLSGGLDSTAIATTASRLLARDGKRLVTISLLPLSENEERVASEKAYIDLLKDGYGFDMQVVRATGSGPFDSLEELVTSASLCAYSYQHFLYSAIFEQASKCGARIVLDGFGGEVSASLFTRGYFAELLLSGKFRTLLRELRDANRAYRSRISAVSDELVKPLLPAWASRALTTPDYSANLRWPIRQEFVRDVLGSEYAQVKNDVFKLNVCYPDHRQNQVHLIEQVRNDIRQHLHAGFPGYHRANSSYPFLDKRVLEFCVAVEGRFKYWRGTGRRLIRMAMNETVPERIVRRNDKIPICPDYNLRYERSKSIAKQVLRSFSGRSAVSEIVDFERAFRSLEAESNNRPVNPMQLDPDSQFMVPSALFLCYFLARYR